MWWVAANGRHLPGVDLPDGSYSARGAGGHYILVVPKYDLVIVHRVNTDIQGQSVTNKEFGELLKRILAARTSTTRIGHVEKPCIVQSPEQSRNRRDVTETVRVYPICEA